VERGNTGFRNERVKSGLFHLLVGVGTGATTSLSEHFTLFPQLKPSYQEKV